MAGYQPRVFFRVFMDPRWLDIGQVLILRVYGLRRITEQTWSIKDLLYVKICLRDTAGSPERARWLHLARPGRS